MQLRILYLPVINTKHPLYQILLIPGHTFSSEKIYLLNFQLRIAFFYYPPPPERLRTKCTWPLPQSGQRVISILKYFQNRKAISFFDLFYSTINNGTFCNVSGKVTKNLLWFSFSLALGLRVNHPGYIFKFF